MGTLETIKTRHSCGKLTTPAPNQQVLEAAFACALRAPDHRVLHPWRYLIIDGEGLNQLGELMVNASRQDNPSLESVEEDRIRKMPLRAPMIIVAITSPKEDPKVPFEEQLLSTGAAIQNFLLALHAQGFGSMWRTGPLSWHPVVSEGLGLESGERIAGFIYVGTELNSARNSALLAIQDFVKKWPL